MTRVGAVVLAAGASTRLGQPKQLLVLDGETLVDRAVRIASDACVTVTAVLGANAELIQKHCRFKDVHVVVNQAWFQGMGSSICAGIAALGIVDGAIVMTCDMPAVTAHHLRRLSESGALTASSYAGHRGIPAYFPAASFPELLSRQHMDGARDLLHDARLVELPQGDLDIDTPEDFARAKAIHSLCLHG